MFHHIKMKKEESEGRSSEKGLQAERNYWKWKKQDFNHLCFKDELLVHPVPTNTMQEVNWRWASCLHNLPHFSTALSAFLAVMCPIPLCLACPPSLFLLPVRGVAGLISFLHVVLWQIPREDWTFLGCSQWTCFWALSWKLCERHPPASCCSRGLLTWLHQSFSLWGTQRTVSYHSFMIAFHIWKILPSLPFSFVLVVSPCFSTSGQFQPTCVCWCIQCLSWGPMSSSTSTSHISPSLVLPMPSFSPWSEGFPYPSHLENATMHGFLEIPMKMFPKCWN